MTTTVLAAGDLFVPPELFISKLTECAGAEALAFRKLTVPWPVQPFGPVEGVYEASGDPDQLIESLQGVEIALTQLAPFSARVFESCSQLRYVGVSRGGPVNVDLEAATAAGVIVAYAPGRNAQAAAEYTVALMLAALRRIPEADRDLRNGRWRGDFYSYDIAGSELGGETVGLIGYGAIGRIVARIVRAFGARVVAYDPYAVEEDDVQFLALDEVLSQSLVVSLHARLTNETHHLLDERRLRRMRPGAVLVNAARGGLLDFAPLPALLESGQLGALALDVYDIEPPPADWPLLHAPRVVLSPHLAGASKQTAHRAASIVGNDAAEFLLGRPPRFVANPAVLDTLENRARS